MKNAWAESWHVRIIDPKSYGPFTGTRYRVISEQVAAKLLTTEAKFRSNASEMEVSDKQSRATLINGLDFAAHFMLEDEAKGKI